MRSPVNQAQHLIARQAAFQRACRHGYREHHRPLPWRTDPSLYRTVVSEFMLQQTQIQTALPYFERWMNAFARFLRAGRPLPETRVLKLWEGLGYYSARPPISIGWRRRSRPARPADHPGEMAGFPRRGPLHRCSDHQPGFQYARRLR